MLSNFRCHQTHLSHMTSTQLLKRTDYTNTHTRDKAQAHPLKRVETGNKCADGEGDMDNIIKRDKRLNHQRAESHIQNIWSETTTA